MASPHEIIFSRGSFVKAGDLLLAQMMTRSLPMPVSLQHTTFRTMSSVEIDSGSSHNPKYSLQFMLANDPLVDSFIQGTVYQAFLSAVSYHRWHSPVDGVIIKAYVVEGSYYSEAQSGGFDPTAPNNTQSYITEVAARAIIFIETDNKCIGLMFFLAIGMAEVSSTEITVHEGQHVRKGEQLGMFHYGGSTHCLIFRPGVAVDFIVKQRKIGTYSHDNIPINSMVASVPFSQ